MPAGVSPTYSELKSRVENLRSPHYFYELGDTNQTVYHRDHVWPGASSNRSGAWQRAIRSFTN
ncbi:MAG: hypothetical protein R3C26_02565 [Calditrichia bacterium]